MKPTPTPEMIETYDAGLLNDFGGGDVSWWQDYLRAELERAHEFYASQFAALSVPAAAVVGEQIEWLKARLADLQLPPGKRDHDTREKWLIQCGMPEAAPSAPDGYVQQLEKALKLAADRLDASSHRVGESDSRAAFGIAQWAIEARASLGGQP